MKKNYQKPKIKIMPLAYRSNLLQGSLDQDSIDVIIK